MAYLHQKFRIGDLVYWYDPSIDAVRRGTVSAVRAEKFTDESKDFVVTYGVKVEGNILGNGISMSMCSDMLHGTHFEAWPTAAIPLKTAG